MDKTTLFDIDEIQDAIVETTLDEIYDALKEKGYNPVSQIVGYLIHDDESYITNYKGARDKIKKMQREKILEVVLRSFLEG